MNGLILILELLESPREALKRFVYERPLAVSVAIVLLAVLGTHISAALFMGFGGKAAGIWMGLGLVLRVIAAFAAWFMAAAVYHFTCELLEGRGSAVSLLYLFAASMAPFLLAPANVLIGLAAGQWVAAIIGVAMVLWVARLQVMSLEVLYGFSFGRALIAYLVPPAALAAVVIACFAVLMGGMTAWALMSL